MIDYTIPDIFCADFYGVLAKSTVTYGAIQGPGGGVVTVEVCEKDKYAIQALKDKGCRVVALFDKSDTNEVKRESERVACKNLGIETLYIDFNDKKNEIEKNLGRLYDIAYVSSYARDVEILNEASDSFYPEDSSDALKINVSSAIMIFRKGGEGVIESIVDNVYHIWDQKNFTADTEIL